jgi:hypothetical protein
MRQQHLTGLALGLVILSINAILFCAVSAVDSSSVSLVGPGLNDSGFRPGADGFSFQNYGDDLKTVDLTSVEMQRMFGDRVCTSTEGGQCVLTYPAERWMNLAISAMKNGHCEGLAVLSNLIYYNQTRSGFFGGNRTIDLSLENVLLQREVGYWWTTQATSPGGMKKVMQSPRAVLDALAESFSEGLAAREWWVMGIYLPDGSGGHAITPFAVKDMGNGTARIFVYDNNWPGEIRFIEVDLASNSWRYLASTNPDEPDSVYYGNASTKNLEIVSLSSRLGQQRCDFCEKEVATGVAGNGSKGAVQGEQAVQVWQSGRARVLVTDGSGRKVGLQENGGTVNEIPGAEIVNLKFGVAQSPVILLPVSIVDDSHLLVNVSSAANDSGKNLANTTIFAPGFDLACSVADLKQDLQQSMDLYSSGQAYNVSIGANRQLSPLLSIESNLRRITLSGLILDPTGMINVSMNPAQGTFSMSTLGNLKPGMLQFGMASLDPASGTMSTFKSLDLILRTDDEVSLDLNSTEDAASMPSLSISRENGGRQEMPMISVSRNVPVSMPEIPEMGNLTLSNVSRSVPSSGRNISMPDSSGTAAGASSIVDMPETVSMPVSSDMPGMGAPAFP